jgi:phosphate transport system substrate-binding protein
MKNKMRKMMAMLSAAVVAVGVMGCGGNAATDSNADANTTSQTADATTDTTASADLSGKITLAGSTSMEKLANAMAEAFMEKYPNVTVAPEFTGSGAGLESLAKGTVDIGDASRALSDDEKAGGAVENIVAIDGIAVITDSENAVSDITSEQLAQIYTGEITNWSDLGGADEQIVVIGREAGSGTRDAFEELNDVKDACKYAQELDSTGAVLAKVAATPGAIGYVSLDVVDDTVKALQLNSVDATEDNILAGTYVLQRPFVMATMGEISEQNDLVKAFFDFIHSEEGQQVITSVGLIIPQ